MFKISSQRVIRPALLAVAVFAVASSNVAADQARGAGLQQRSIKVKSRSAKAPAAVGCAPCGGAAARLKGGTRLGKATPCHPRGYVDPKIAKNFNAAMRDLKRAGIKPQVTSLWRSSEDQARLHNCSGSRRCRRANPGLYRALPPGQSLHEAGLAVDMSGIASGARGAKRLTPRGRRIVGIMRKNGFRWRYGLADPAHFEADPRKVGYRDIKQAIARSQSTCAAKAAYDTRPGRKAPRGLQRTAAERRATSIKQPSAQVSSMKQPRHSARVLTGA